MRSCKAYVKLSFLSLIGILLALQAGWAQVQVQNGKVVLERGRSTVVLEPYAPNIIRVTLSTEKKEALAKPGYGIVASPSPEGWSYHHTSKGYLYSSSRLHVLIPALRKRGPIPLNQRYIARFFSRSGAPRYPNTRVIVSTTGGKTLVNMERWSMRRPSHGIGDSEILYDRRPTDKPFYQVGATFASPAGEHYYGLGENQEGYLDHRDHDIQCWSNYLAAGGESFCVPFLVTNKGYGIIWDNPSKTTIMPGFNNQTRWVSQVGNRVSFFVIAGPTIDEIYEGYRKLTGPAQMLPKYAYGFIQSKNRYNSQKVVLGVAKGYRERHLPLDMIVVDWWWYTKMGNLTFNHENWPNPAEMNKELHGMGIHTLISVWPRFAPGSRYYDLLLKNGWFMHLANGKPTKTNSYPGNRMGSNIDTTNPAAAKWFWDTIRNNIVSKGFNGIWLDETEPDIPPNGSYFYIGPGTRYFNVYPLFHTASVYDGWRKDFKTRVVILARAAYLGAQRNGTIFWSSDISSTWDALRRQIPTGLDVTASGLPYWCNDVGGFLPMPKSVHLAHPPLISPAGARANVGGDIDYPELYVRWFEYGAFEPIFRTHGTRRYNEVWTYGKQAEPILAKYLRLRYTLMPYIYSLAYQTYKTGAPYMRALFMDFPNDPKVDDIGDEYMFGPAFLVAPVTTQGATTKKVYLPAGADWYNYWTNQRYKGGQTIVVNAPIGILPLFVRAGSIVPMGVQVESMAVPQKLLKVRVYAGANANFDLYRDNGKTYAYEKGDYKITHLHWNEATHKLTQKGAVAWTVPNSQMVQVIGK